MKNLVWPMLVIALGGCAVPGYKDTKADSLNQLNQPAVTETYSAEVAQKNPREKLERRFLKKAGLRIFSTSEVFDGETVSDNLVRMDYEGVGFAYERLDDGQGRSFGAKFPVGKFLGLRKAADLYLLRFEDIENDREENEVVARIEPFQDHELDIVVRGIDLQDSDGFALATNYRQNPNFDAKNNLGGGIAFIELGDENNLGAYVWGRFGQFKGLFLGAGTYLNSKNFVIGVPNKGGFTWRYFRIDKDNGYQRNEFLFSTEGVNLNGIDSWATIHTNEFDHNKSISGNRGVYRYIDPPISARGEGWTGGVIHTETVDGKDFLKTELVKYIDKVFVGLQYDADLDSYGDGRAGIPLGYQLKGGDGLTRNFVRAMPFYDIGTNDWGIRIVVEYKSCKHF